MRHFKRYSVVNFVSYETVRKISALLVKWFLGISLLYVFTTPATHVLTETRHLMCFYTKISTGSGCGHVEEQKILAQSLRLGSLLSHLHRESKKM